jgi:hypothetical protein
MRPFFAMPHAADGWSVGVNTHSMTPHARATSFAHFLRISVMSNAHFG